MTKASTKEPKIVCVKSWRDLPTPTKGARASSNFKTNTIHAVKGVATESDIEHERYHIKHRHGGWVNAEQMVRNELTADLYAYKKTGEPRSYSGRFGMIWVELRSVFGCTILEAMRILKRELEAIDAPKGWRLSYDRGWEQFQKNHRNEYSDKTISGLRLKPLVLSEHKNPSEIISDISVAKQKTRLPVARPQFVTRRRVISQKPRVRHGKSCKSSMPSLAGMRE